MGYYRDEGRGAVRSHKALLCYLVDLSLVIRLAIAIGSTVLFLIVFLFLPGGDQNPSVFAIPIALIAWMFSKRGLLVALAILIIVLWLYYWVRVYQTVWWPWYSILYFLVSVSSLVFIGLLICAQRGAFNLADEAAEQSATACDQQKELADIQDQFLQNVNHELRTLLTAILGEVTNCGLKGLKVVG
jgi:signal transduction histidine kinase